MNIALLGAGFTRNWGGLLAAEVVGELSGRIHDDPELLHRLKTSAFEQVLSELRQDASLGPSQQRRFERLQTAVLDTFDDMNEALAVCGGLGDRPGDGSLWISTFLARFDAIFTLNQDLFLEMHYWAGSTLKQFSRWKAMSYPGIALPNGWYKLSLDDRRRTVLPESGSMARDPEHQPFYKLHGSTNWQSTDGQPLVVIGGSKDATIRGSTLLSGYLKAFEDCLTVGNAKLMTIGYSFGDKHINDLIGEASTRAGLQTYLVDPAGLAVFRNDPPNLMQPHKPILDRINLCGNSMRPFREAFRSDVLSFRSFHRFLGIDLPKT
jgi:hypothetical protein